MICHWISWTFLLGKKSFLPFSLFHYSQRSKLDLKQTKDLVVTLSAPCGMWVGQPDATHGALGDCPSPWCCCFLYVKRKDSEHIKRQIVIGSSLRILRNPFKVHYFKGVQINLKTIFMHFLLIHYGLCSEQANRERQNVDYAC